jgi:hypothetical protein
MDNTLTVNDLLLPGEPLDPAEVLAGQSALSNPVTWVVSLRPYPPAFPRLRGGELALVATEHLARLEPPTTLADVVRQLASRDASAVVVRGETDRAAVEAAGQLQIPLLKLVPDAPLQDIEQAIMRECALYQARREMLPSEDAGSWVVDLLEGRITSAAEVQSLAHKQGRTLAAAYAVAFALPQGQSKKALEEAETRLKGRTRSGVIAEHYGEGLVVLLPPNSDDTLRAALAGSGLACGISTSKPLLDAPQSLAEAQMACTASRLMRGGAHTRYADLGADRLLLTLHRDHLDELATFVEETIGPLLRHDARSATPLLPTLRSFIEHGGRLRETAAEIYVHRNTLAYRLDRAAEILGVDLKNADRRLAIELALRALPLLS